MPLAVEAIFYIKHGDCGDVGPFDKEACTIEHALRAKRAFNRRFGLTSAQIPLLALNQFDCARRRRPERTTDLRSWGPTLVVPRLCNAVDRARALLGPRVRIVSERGCHVASAVCEERRRKWLAAAQLRALQPAPRAAARPRVASRVCASIRPYAMCSMGHRLYLAFIAGCACGVEVECA